MAVAAPEVIPIAARERGPGPGRYNLSSLCGFDKHCSTRLRHPAYSLGARRKPITKDCSPGPVYAVVSGITRNGVADPYAPSLGYRHKILAGMRVPGPGAYAPENAHPQGERRAPIYSMGIVTKAVKGDVNPPPNNYTLPPIFGRSPCKNSAPAYSMSARAEVGSFKEDLAKTPGPAAHSVDNRSSKPRAAAYSLQGRTTIPGDKTVKPGPGAHRPENVYVNTPDAPAFSMGIRHSDYVAPLIIRYDD